MWMDCRMTCEGSSVDRNSSSRDKRKYIYKAYVKWKIGDEKGLIH